MTSTQFTRRHFRAIAAIIATLPEEEASPARDFGSRQVTPVVSKGALVDYFETTNPRFDRDRFSQACQSTKCGCCDAGCPIGHEGDCRSTATTWLIRVDNMAGEPLPFCDACADDAYASGVFADAEGVA